MQQSVALLVSCVASLSVAINLSTAAGTVLGHISPHARGSSLAAVISCNSTFYVSQEDKLTCKDVQLKTGVDLSTIELLNTGFTCDANTLIPGDTYVCLDQPSIPSQGTVSCVYSYFPLADDSCGTIQQAFDLDSTTFSFLNPSIDCQSLPILAPICLEGTLSTNSKVLLGGSPYQSATVISYTSAANCGQFATVRSPTACLDISSASKVSITTLLNLNSGMDCWGLKQNNTLCIGNGKDSTVIISSLVASSTADISSFHAPNAAPQPTTPSPQAITAPPQTTQPPKLVTEPPQITAPPKVEPQPTTPMPQTTTPTPPLTDPPVAQQPLETVAPHGMVNTIDTVINVPGQGSNFAVSWNWFAGPTTDCDASITASQYNTGFYAGSENIPADCGKKGTFIYNGNTVTVTYAWRTTGGPGYHEITPQAFANLVGSGAKVDSGTTVDQFKTAIQDPGRISAACSGVC